MHVFILSGPLLVEPGVTSKRRVRLYHAEFRLARVIRPSNKAELGKFRIGSWRPENIKKMDGLGDQNFCRQSDIKNRCHELTRISYKSIGMSFQVSMC